MRGFIIICISTLAIAVPQGYVPPAELQDERLSPTDIEPLEPSKTSQELPNIKQSQKFSIELPLSKELSSALEQHNQEMMYFRVNSEHVSMPFLTYGALPILPQNLRNEVLISKQFFLHTAPDEEDEEVQEKVFTVGQNRKNYNVVFIRAPTKPQKTAVVKVIPAINEDKTVIYVLSKKSEADDVDARIEEVPTATSKPEVYFIRYKTPEEAAHAQAKIQTEYERLGGSTLITNEGVSKITSVIGSLDAVASKDQSMEENLDASGELENALADGSIELPSQSEYLLPNFKK